MKVLIAVTDWPVPVLGTWTPQQASQPGDTWGNYLIETLINQTSKFSLIKQHMFVFTSLRIYMLLFIYLVLFICNIQYYIYIFVHSYIHKIFMLHYIMSPPYQLASSDEPILSQEWAKGSPDLVEPGLRVSLSSKNEGIIILLVLSMEWRNDAKLFPQSSHSLQHQ
jgi:hypothetical protein